MGPYGAGLRRNPQGALRRSLIWQPRWRRCRPAQKIRRAESPSSRCGSKSQLRNRLFGKRRFRYRPSRNFRKRLSRLESDFFTTRESASVSSMRRAGKRNRQDFETREVTPFLNLPIGKDDQSSCGQLGGKRCAHPLMLNSTVFTIEYSRRDRIGRRTHSRRFDLRQEMHADVICLKSCPRSCRRRTSSRLAAIPGVGDRRRLVVAVASSRPR